MKAQPQQEDALLATLRSNWQQASAKLQQLAAELPEGKLDWRPQQGLRTCAEVLRHVAFWNHYAAESIRGNNPDGNLNELPASEFSGKAAILAALEQSSQDVSDAMSQKGVLDSQTSEVVASFLGHAAEHYGQLVVYARILNIVPPASRS